MSSVIARGEGDHVSPLSAVQQGVLIYGGGSTVNITLRDWCNDQSYDKGGHVWDFIVQWVEATLFLCSLTLSCCCSFAV